MRVNGYIINSGATNEPTEPIINEYGEVVAVVNNESDNLPKVECCVQTLSDNRIGRYEDGEFHASSYKIFVEGDFSVSVEIDVYRRGVLLGRFKVQRVEFAESMNRTIILV